MTVESALYDIPTPDELEPVNGPDQMKAMADAIDAIKWGSRSLKPTVFSAYCTNSHVLTHTEMVGQETLEGTSRQITLDVAGFVKVDVIFEFETFPTATEDNRLEGALVVGTTVQTPLAKFRFQQLGAPDFTRHLSVTAAQTFLVPLPAGTYKLGLRARTSASIVGEHKVLANNTGYTGIVVAS